MATRSAILWDMKGSSSWPNYTMPLWWYLQSMDQVEIVTSCSIRQKNRKPVPALLLARAFSRPVRGQCFIQRNFQTLTGQILEKLITRCQGDLDAYKALRYEPTLLHSQMLILETGTNCYVKYKRSPVRSNPCTIMLVSYLHPTLPQSR